MENSSLQTFAKLVQEMRKAQKEYFKSRKMGLQTVSNDWLNKSKKLEREVDDTAAEIMQGGQPQKLF